jgi:hypothetical protein
MAEPLNFGAGRQPGQAFPKDFIEGMQIRIQSFRMLSKEECSSKYFNKEGKTGCMEFTDSYGKKRFLYNHSQAFLDDMARFNIIPDSLGILTSRKELMKNRRGFNIEVWRWEWKPLE